MNPLQVVFGVAVVIALLIKLDQLRRFGPVRARVALTIYLTLLLAKWVLSQPAVITAVDSVLVPGVGKAAEMILALSALYVLLGFFLHASGSPRRARWEAVPAVVASVGVVVALFSAPAAVRPLIYEHGGPTTLQAVLFIVLGNGYQTYALVIGFVATRRFARLVVDRHVRTGLQIAAAGLLVDIVFADAGQDLSVIVRHVGGAFPSWVDGITYFMAVLGTIIVYIGVSWAEPAAATSRWVARRRVLLALRYLWTRLYPLFPETALDGPPTSERRDRADPRRMRYRYDRRKVECRDALWSLGPWIDDVLPPSPAEQGPAVREALARKAAGTEALRATPAPLAAPENASKGAAPATVAPAFADETTPRDDRSALETMAEDTALWDLSRSLRHADRAAASTSRV